MAGAAPANNSTVMENARVGLIPLDVLSLSGASHVDRH
jgi:hypothetical protein